MGSTLPLRIISYNIRCDSASTKRAASSKAISRLKSQFFDRFCRLQIWLYYTADETLRCHCCTRIGPVHDQKLEDKADSHATRRSRRATNRLRRRSIAVRPPFFRQPSAVRDSWDQNRVGYTYGLYGTPTTLELAARICELESGAHTILTPGGQAAISLINLALLQAGDHILVPTSVYFPNRQLAIKLLGRFGITTTFYEPTIGAGISALLQENTRLVWCESPGSITMEVQDLPAIVAAAHARNVLVVLDNTWSAGVLLDAFHHGVDVTMQAVTKYIGGHSDLLLGSVTVRDAQLYQQAWRNATEYRLRGFTRRLQPGPARITDAGGPAFAYRKFRTDDRQMARGTPGNRARSASGAGFLPGPRILEARFSWLFGSVFDCFQTRPDASASSCLRRRTATLQGGIQLGGRHQPGDFLQHRPHSRPATLRSPHRSTQHRSGVHRRFDCRP